MRRFIRHPADFPMVVATNDSHRGERASLCDIGQGGLACQLARALPPGSPVTLRIPSLQPDFPVSGRVVSCAPCARGFRVSIQFSDEAETFKSKMVEQVCQIEHYRRELRRAGRELDIEAAAREWIERFGSQFAENFSG